MTAAMPELRQPRSMPTADGIDPAAPAALGSPAGGSDQAAPDCAIVLVGLSHPALGDIAIEDTLFAVGRTETPFDAYPADIVADL